MTRYNDEKFLGTMVILGDVVQGTSSGTFEDAPEEYITVRFRHATLAVADGPVQDDLIGRLHNESDYGEVDPDGVVVQGIRFIHDQENGRL